MTEKTCKGCEQPFDPDTDFYLISPVDGEAYCEGCRESDLNSAGRVLLFGPGYAADRDGQPIVFVGSLFIEDRYGEEPSDGLVYQHNWVSTDAWRGYAVTSIDGWVEILDGWTTGNWGDAISAGKQPFNEWVEALCNGDVDPPVPVAVITDVTSNVFSTAVGVWVPEEYTDTFREWLNGDLDVLTLALT